MRSPSSAFDARLLRGAALLVSSLFLATCERGQTAPAVPTQLAFSVQPTTTTAGHQITPAVQVTALDAGGRPVPGFTQNVTVTLTAGTGTSGATLTGTTTVAAANGVATFYALTLDKSSTGYTLTATASGLSAATSARFDINPGPATHLVFTVQPGNATAGATIAPAVEVTAQDASGNTVPTFTAQVTVALGGTNPSGGTLAGTKTVAAVSGVASFATLSIDKSGSYWLTAGAGGLSGGTSSDFSIAPGPATQLAFTVQPVTTTAGHQIAPAVQLSALDALGNVVPSFTGDVTVALGGTNPSGGTLSGTTSVAAANGVAIFYALSLDKSGTGYTLTATASGLSAATSAPFDITPGAATHLVFTVQPANTTAGATLTPAVQVAAQDAAGNTVPSFTGSVTLALGGTNPAGGVLAGTTTVAAVNGAASFATLSVDKSGDYWLAARATGLSGGTSSDFSVSPGAATHLTFTVQPGTTTAGHQIAPAVKVAAQDALGNVVPSFTGSVTVALGSNPAGSTLSGSATVSAVSGVATFGDLSINTSGSGYTLTATATGLTGATSTPFGITPGAATHLVFTVQPANATAGTTLTPAVQVAAQDAAGNTVPSFSGSVTVALGGTNPAGGTLAGTTTVPAVSGVASFGNLSLDKVGTGYTLTAAAAGLTGATSNSFNVTVGAASQLVFTVQPTNTTAGATITPALQVTVLDGQGNTATGFTGNVTVAFGSNPGGGTLAGTTTVAAVSGVASFASLSIAKVGTGYTLTAAAAGLPGATSAAFTVTPGAAAKLVFTVQPSNTAAGAAITPAVQVTAQDAQGNTASGFTGTVTVGHAANPVGGTLSGHTTVAASAGVATLADLSLDRAGTGYTLTAAGGGLSGATSAAFNITVGAATQLVFTVQPSTAVAARTISPAVQVAARDAQGNLVSAFAGSGTVALGTNPSGGTPAGTTTVTAAGGVATFGTLSVDKVGTGYTLTATAPGLSGATSSAFTVTVGAATQFVFSVQPSATSAGAAITPAVQVTALDAGGNVATGFAGSVAVALGTNPSGGTLAGTTTVPAVSGVASFASLSLNKVGSGYTLTAAAPFQPALTGATSSLTDISARQTAQLLFTVQPTGTTAGAVITPAVQVTAQDGLGNTVPSFTGTVTVALGNNPVAGTLTGTTTVAATNGVASFASLSIDRAGSGYTLTAAATGVTTGSSAAFSITPGTAATLLFTVQPSNALAGAAITPAVQVVAHDAQGNTATGFSGNVTMALGANPGSGTLAGTTTVAAASGVATFANLSINKAGTGYTLTASASGPTSATSNPFTVSAAAATPLAFTVQPPNGAAGAALTPAVQVTARDAQGNVATDFTGTVTVALGVNPGSATLSGPISVAAVSGVATFYSLSIDKVGTG